MADEALIVAEGLTKRFSAAAAPAIDGLTARVGPGRVTGLVGPDAAGKTTLMRLFAGLLLPSDGRLMVCAAACNLPAGESRAIPCEGPHRTPSAGHHSAGADLRTGALKSFCRRRRGQPGP